jgi:Raf kinase inhibitor-like YbhB/YbcL family protein
MLRTPVALFAASLALASAAIAAGAAIIVARPAYNPGERHTMSFVLETKAFPKGGEIPARYTCSGDDLSPALSWSGVPQNTKSFALIVDDPDAPSGTFTHWLVYDLPAATHHLPESVSRTDDQSGGGRQGRNDFGRVGYGGPCPPPGKAHRYFFRLYALNAPLSLPAGASRQALEAAMRGHVIAQAELMGKFAR